MTLNTFLGKPRKLSLQLQMAVVVKYIFKQFLIATRKLLEYIYMTV